MSYFCSKSTGWQGIAQKGSLALSRASGTDSVRRHRRQPIRLHRAWDFPGKNTGAGCQFLLQCMKVKSESEVAQSCPTLATPWTAAYQAPPSMGFSRQKYWSGVPLPSPNHKILECILDTSSLTLHRKKSS